MPFELIKLIAGLLMPVPVILGLLILGLALLALTRFQRTAIALLAVGTGLLLALSTPMLPELALNQLETAYPVLQNPPDAQWIVVLGGGVREAESGTTEGTEGQRDKGAKGWSSAHLLSESSLYRLAEGVRLAKVLPRARLVTSGGSYSGEASTARLMAETAAAWGVSQERIIVQDQPMTTAEEAQAVAKRVHRDELIILVTSAFHMQRAVALFHGQGVQVVPAPAGHLVDSGRAQKHIGHQLPQAGYIEYAERVLWEWLGLVWARLRG